MRIKTVLQEQQISEASLLISVLEAASTPQKTSEPRILPRKADQDRVGWHQPQAKVQVRLLSQDGALPSISRRFCWKPFDFSIVGPDHVILQGSFGQTVIATCLAHVLRFLPWFMVFGLSAYLDNFMLTLPLAVL